MRSQQRGFARLDTLVASLLVVLALGMLLPAAQELKEAEKRQKCASNLKQLGLAAHNYDSTFGKLPPGWLGPLENEKPGKFEEVQNLSVLVHLLPFIEQDRLYKQVLEASQADYLRLTKEQRAWYKNAELMKAASSLLKDLLCPSAPSMLEATDGIMVAVHFANRSGEPKQALIQPPMHWLPRKDAAFEKLGRTNYFGVSGMYGRGTNVAFPGTLHGIARFEGIFTNRSINSLNLLTTADGASNTLMFGEATGGSHDWEAEKPTEKKPMQYATSWMGAGALPTAGGLAQHGDRSFWYQFSSAHEGIVNFCFGDGAVRSLRIGKTATVLFPKPEFPSEPKDRSAGSPYWVLQELAGMRDGGLRPWEGIVVKDPP